jgi:CheY-like chemotaxis protein
MMPTFMNIPDSRSSIRLLLIDDHPDLAEVTSEILCTYGMDVRIASSGHEALETATAFRPQIILCDLSIPDMSGLDIARALRTRPETKNALFALHTALHPKQLFMLQESNGSEIDLFLSKPITREMVNQLLAGLTRRQVA